jgi:site-specific recombinase XerD
MLPVDCLAVTSLSEALWQARETGDQRPPFAVIAGCLDELGVALPQRRGRVTLVQAREEWLRRLRSASRSDSTVAAYRIALGDLARWLAAHDEEADVFSEQTIVTYLADYRRRARPAPATYYRRFVLLRRFFRWLSRRAGVPDPFLELDAPGKPRHVADWLTGEEFARMLAAAAA